MSRHVVTSDAAQRPHVPETVILGLGSNVGDCEAHLSTAIAAIAGILSDIAVSSIYRTEPVGYRNQPDFLNIAVSGVSRIAPLELLTRLQAIEHDAGRRRGEGPRFGPRTLDIDIVLFGERIIATPELEVPHPRMHERLFVLIPVLEIAPGAVDPRSNEPLEKLKQRLPASGIYCHKRAGVYSQSATEIFQAGSNDRPQSTRPTTDRPARREP